MLKRLSLLSLLTVCILVLGACSQTTEEDQTEDTNNKELQHDTQSHDMKGMNHSGSGEVPEDLKVAENPYF